MTTYEDLLGQTIMEPISKAIALISILLNGMVLFFILCKTPKKLKEYARFLIPITVYDLLLDVTAVYLTQPVFLFPLMGAIVTGPYRYLGQTFGAKFSILSCFYIVASSTTNASLVFVYRYLNLVHPDKLEWFVNWKTQLFVQLLRFILTAGTSLLLLFTWQDLNIFLPKVYAIYPQLWHLLDSECIFGFGPREEKMPNYPFFLSTGLLFISSAICNAWFSIKIIRHLRSYRGSMSASTYKMHLRLTTALIFQSLSPIIFLCMPMLILSVTLLFGQNRTVPTILGGSVMTMLSLHPVFNALCTIYFVQPYRRLITRPIIKFGQLIGLMKITQTNGIRPAKSGPTMTRVA